MDNILLIFAGARHSGPNPTYLYLLTDEDDNTGDRYFEGIAEDVRRDLEYEYGILLAQRLTVSRPGTILQVEGEANDNQFNIDPDTTINHGVWLNHEDLLRWQTLHDAAERALIGEQSVNMGDEHDAFIQSLQPLKEIYASATPAHRNHILARVVQFITQGA